MNMDDLMPSEIADVLSDKIFSIRSDRIVTVITDKDEEQVLLPKFIKRDNLENKKEELRAALKKSINKEKVCVVVNSISKNSNKLAGLYVLKSKIVFISKENVEKLCGKHQYEDTVYVDCQEMFA